MEKQVPLTWVTPDMEWKGSKEWFDKYSFLHFSSGFSITQIMIHLIPSKKLAIILSIIGHFLEDYYQNVHGEGIEGILKRIMDCGDFLDFRDHDSMQNFLGDNISYIIGAFLAGIFFLMPLNTLLILQVARLFGLFLYCKNI